MAGFRLSIAQFVNSLALRVVLKRSLIIVMFAFSLSCSSVPDMVKPVSEFDLPRFMGTWFEIARLDHRFERGLEKVTAQYTLLDDGSVRVVNKGFSPKKNEWKEAVGKAKVASDVNMGALKVSFFGPFYGPYVVYELDKMEYQYAFVSSGEGYLWLLARSPTVDEEIKERFIESAKTLGYQESELIFVAHGTNTP